LIFRRHYRLTDQNLTLVNRKRESFYHCFISTIY